MGGLRGAVACAAVVWWFGLLLWPDLALRIWWGGLIPLLPAVWLIAPRLWRNVCPVAALEVGVGGRSGRTLGPGASVWWGSVGLVLFAVLVTLRPLVFEGSGEPLAAAVALTLCAAWLRGRTHAVRAGFCNALCPLGGVERLYGQRPMISVAPAHCATCSACTRRGCPDVADAKALRQLIGVRGGRGAWLRRPHGMFTAAMPGFVLGYGLSVGTPGWLPHLAVPALGALASWLGMAALSRVTPEAFRALPPACAGLSALAFYQLVAPASVAAWGLPWLTWAVRWSGTMLVAAWSLAGEVFVASLASGHPTRGAPRWTGLPR